MTDSFFVMLGRTWGTLCLLAIALVAAWPAAAFTAPQIEPDARVVRYVVVREGPSTDTQPIDELDPGETLAFVADLPRWYQVQTADGRIGYVSKTWTLLRDAPAGQYKLHAIDVGTGLSIFVEGPDFTLLYDAGSQDDTRGGTRNRVRAYLAKIRPELTTIDHVVISHAHKDHISLLPDILLTYAVRNIWDSGRVYDSCGYRSFLLQVAGLSGTVYRTVRGPTGPVQAVFRECNAAPDTISVPASQAIPATSVPLGVGASMRFLHLDATDHDDPNENSLVLMLSLGGKRVLIAGDAEAGARDEPSGPLNPQSIEARLIDCCRAELAADVLVAGHHGSKTSSRNAFLDAVAARTYIISSGPFLYSGTGLPDQVIVDEFTRRGSLFRTDANDAACRTDVDKIGPDNDGKVGGCDNILVDIDAAGVRTRYNAIAD